MSVVAAKNMDEAVEQLDYAVQAAYEDESVQLALNATTDLLFYGVEPDRGLDVLDLMLIRKMNLRTECGDPKYAPLRSLACESHRCLPARGQRR
jgi:hypothetical protein